MLQLCMFPIDHRCCDLHQYRRNLACYQCDDFIFATQLLGSSVSCYRSLDCATWFDCCPYHNSCRWKHEIKTNKHLKEKNAIHLPVSHKVRCNSQIQRSFPNGRHSSTRQSQSMFRVSATGTSLFGYWMTAIIFKKGLRPSKTENLTIVGPRK